MKIMSTGYTEINSCYDLARAWNGGGYSQPTIAALMDDGGILIIEDTSCGEFGSRISAMYASPKGVVTKCRYGSMLSEGDMYSSFSQEEHGELLMLVASELGYHFPTAAEIDDMMEGR